jgi:hypothetical protein
MLFYPFVHNFNLSIIYETKSNDKNEQITGADHIPPEKWTGGQI